METPLKERFKYHMIYVFFWEALGAMLLHVGGALTSAE